MEPGSEQSSPAQPIASASVRDQIKAILRAVGEGEEVRRNDVARRIGARPFRDGGAFAREFENARKELWSEGVLFSNRLGGRYERVADEDRGVAVISQSRRKMKKSYNAAVAAQAVLAAAPKSDLDENARAVLARQEERTIRAAADLKFIRRQRKFEE